MSITLDGNRLGFFDGVIMDLITEASNFVWLQQKIATADLQAHLGLSQRQLMLVLQRLEKLGVISTTKDGAWQASVIPTHFFQKKGRSLYLCLTIYLRPQEGSQVVGVIEPNDVFLTHQQSGYWWLVCNSQGRMGYIKMESLRLVHLDE